jgi:hypothetical protein
MDGHIRLSNFPLSLITTVPLGYCPNNQPPFIRSATLENVELHLVQNVQNDNNSSDSYELLTFNFGNQSLPTGYIDRNPNNLTGS